MFTLPKLTYKFKVIIIKTSSQCGFFLKLDKLISKLLWKRSKSKITRKFLKKLK